MGDIFCRKCGEPWESFGITRCRGEGALSIGEADGFLRGEGCPCCHFGQHCPSCSGTGKSSECGLACACRGSRFLIIRRLTDGVCSWRYGYPPNGNVYPGEPTIIYRYPDSLCREGRVSEALVLCPFCAPSAPDCPVCRGSGDLQPIEPERFGAALATLVEEAEDDPTLYLESRRR